MYSKDKELRFAFEDKTSPHNLIMPFIGENSKVLDVGCNTGYIGECLIKNKNCVCDGIDCAKKFLKKAKDRGYRNTYKIDLYNTNFDIKEKYDYILFIDILEHLPNPFMILRKLVKENLKKDGNVIICLPNIARLEYRLSHLLGKFDYEKSGVLHQDHLRFFTKKSAANLIKICGLVPEKVLPTGLGARIHILSTLSAFQFIFLCRKK